ncbi:hypothetical protein ACKKBF_B19280 [Auxenochlorella protothecoides x Auxenochlorella symbiontica]
MHWIEWEWETQRMMESPSPHGSGLSRRKRKRRIRNNEQHEARAALTCLQWGREFCAANLFYLPNLRPGVVQDLLRDWRARPVTQCGKRFWGGMLDDYLRAAELVHAKAASMLQGGWTTTNTWPALLILILRLHIMYTPGRTVRTEHEWRMWEPVFDRVSRSLRCHTSDNEAQGLQKEFFIIKCMARALFPDQGICAGSEGDLPLFSLRPYSQDPAEDYCPTVLPDFLERTCLTPFEAFIVLQIVIYRFEVAVSPKPGWETDLFSTVFSMRGRKLRQMKQPINIHFEPLPGRHPLCCVIRTEPQPWDCPQYVVQHPGHYYYWGDLLLKYSVQSYERASRRWQLPRDQYVARRALAILGALYIWVRKEHGSWRDSETAEHVRALQAEVEDEQHLSRIRVGMRDEAMLEKYWRNNNWRQLPATACIDVPSDARQLLHHELGQCRYAPGTVVRLTSDLGSSYRIVMYTGRHALPDVEANTNGQGNLCATLCMDQTRVRRGQDPNFSWVRYAPERSLVAVPQEELKRCIIEWLKLRPGIGRFFDSWDRILCSFVPNCALAALNGHLPPTALFQDMRNNYVALRVGERRKENPYLELAKRMVSRW